MYTSTVSITHSEFIDNIVTGPWKFSNGCSSLVYLDAVMITVSFSKFINNRASFAAVLLPYYHYTAAGNITNNVFSDNSAAYEVYVSPKCRSGLAFSLGSNRCVQCSENWRRDLIGIVIAAIIAGILLVIFMLVFNMTVAVGTLNGIFFYANIVAANADMYLSPFKSPDLSQYLYHGLILILALIFASVDLHLLRKFMFLKPLYDWLFQPMLSCLLSL